MISRIVLFAICLCLPFLSCVPSTGGSTETTNSVVGKLYLCDGKTPAKGARVAIRSKTMLPDLSRAGLLKRTADTASVITDDSGAFAFLCALDTGIYVVEGASGACAVLIDSVEVKSEDAAVTLAPEILKPVGAISGVLRLRDVGDSSKVFVVALGLDRYAKAASDGSFLFPALAQGNYALRVVTSGKILETAGEATVAVKSNDTTRLDTVDVVEAGIPGKNVRVSMLRPSSDEIRGWSMAPSPDSFTLWTANTISDDVDGGFLAYTDRGVLEIADLHLLGPLGTDGVRRELAVHSFIMDFGNDSKAAAMFDFPTARFSGEAFPLPGYDAAEAFARPVLGGISAYAHFDKFYFELSFLGFSDRNEAAAAGKKFLDSFHRKIRILSGDKCLTVGMLKVNGGDIPGWKPASAADSFSLWTAKNFYEHVDGAFEVYTDRGMVEAADFRMVGAADSAGRVHEVYPHSFIMDFESDSNASIMYHHMKTVYSSDVVTAIPGYDTATAFGVPAESGITMHAHCGYFYFQVLFLGFSDRNQALSAGKVFLDFFKGKIGESL
jgi:hypothetical protein